MGSSLRDNVNKAVGADFNFHIRRQYFQAGLLMSGYEFNANNNVQAHLGYGLRREKSKKNFALYGGISYFTGVLTLNDSALGQIPYYYDGIGAYVCGQAIAKITYDIGAGIEVFAEYSLRQKMIGAKLILFFSGAYRGEKKNFNPNVRSENQK